MASQFAEGDRVEVKRKDGGYFDAVVLGRHASRESLIFVEFKTIVVAQRRLKEYVDLDQLRPVPPLELNRCFKPGDCVDAFLESDGGWRRGFIREILENSKYVVDFGGMVQEVAVREIEQHNVRIHREWGNGSWFPPVQLQQQDLHSEQNGKPMKLRVKFKCGRVKPERKFKTGVLVEVTSNEDGFRGSWFPARVLASMRDKNFLVEYLTLKTEDGTKPLTEQVEALFIRPDPPELPKIAAFSAFQVVDAWYNDGWWIGKISEVLGHAKYIVYFSSTREEIEFEHTKLRVHQDWMKGRWKIPAQEHITGGILQEKSDVLNCSRKLRIRLGDENLEKFIFRKGMKVEVKSDEAGYNDAWYQAVIVDTLGNDKFLVEYLTLTTEDGTQNLREEAHYSYIRPFPPCISHPPRYGLLDSVDAWFNEGWWKGNICGVLSRKRYDVYFKSTNEKLQFEHANLRPRQEWTGQKWILLPKDNKL